jgi:AcrR family transcriptional regulator
MTRPQQAEANRSAVLDAAFRAFAAEGYAAASLDRLADAAGFSKGAVYSRFASKADLFLAVLERRIEQRAADNAEELSTALAADGDAVTALATRMTTTSAGDPGWHLALIEFRVVAARDAELRDRYAAIHARTVERLAALLDEMTERLDLAAPVSSTALARTLLALELGGVLEDEAAAAPRTSEERILVLRSILDPARATEATR